MRINLANIPVLCLNASYEALNVISAKRAFTSLAKGIAVMEKTSTVTINRGKFLVPSVIRLLEYRRVPRRTRTLSRKGILARDQHTCQYCMDPQPATRLTLDHIIPRSRGGANAWENLVASCFACNNLKADRTPEEAGMPLGRRPKPFSVHTSRHLLRESGAAQADWQQYLFYANDTPQVSAVGT
jgi:5-methylcytosine-specific restriction endonuclease McrA